MVREKRNYKGVVMSSKIKKATMILLAAAAATLLVAQPALADTGRASITNSGSRDFQVCRSASSETTCGVSSTTLRPGQNTASTFGWADADLVWASAGCQLQTWDWNAYTGNAWQPFASGGSSGRWIKLAGNPAGTRTYSFRLIC